MDRTDRKSEMRGMPETKDRPTQSRPSFSDSTRLDLRGTHPDGAVVATGDEEAAVAGHGEAPGLRLVSAVRQNVLEVVRVPVLDRLVLRRREEAVRPRHEAEGHHVVLVRQQGAVPCDRWLCAQLSQSLCHSVSHSVIDPSCSLNQLLAHSISYSPTQSQGLTHSPVAVAEVEAPDLDGLVGRGGGDELVVLRHVHGQHGELVAVEAMQCACVCVCEDKTM